MVRADVFLQVLWQFLAVRLRRVLAFSQGDFLAAAGGENRSNYLKNTVSLQYGSKPFSEKLLTQFRRNFPKLSARTAREGRGLGGRNSRAVLAFAADALKTILNKITSRLSYQKVFQEMQSSRLFLQSECSCLATYSI